MSDKSDCVFAVGLTAGLDAGYEARVSVRLSGDSQERVTSGHPVALDTEKLRTFLAEQDYPGYAEQLTKDLFGNQQVYGQFVGARFVATRERSRLLVRLSLPPNDSTLQQVAWELLRDPDAQFDLAAVELGKDSRKPLSRYLPPPLPALPTRKSTGRLRSVVLIANPLMENYEAINVEEQRHAVAVVLENDTDVTYLLGGQANQQNLLGEIAAGVDIVYIVCHGQQALNGPVLYFETTNRKTEAVDSAKMVRMIVSQGIAPPQLVVFGSCESAVDGGVKSTLAKGVVASVGAMMVAAGVPAVVGMQGAIDQQSNQQFSEAFFRALFEEGQVEHAISVGRGKITLQDWWMPVLMMSRDDGQLWPSSRGRESFSGWDVLVDAIRQGGCTPVLGSEVLPPFSNRQLAVKLLEELSDRVGSAGPDELAWIAQQYDIYKQIKVRPRLEVLIRSRLRLDHDAAGPFKQETGESIDAFMARWAKPQWDLAPQQNKLTILKQLADLDCKHYITTNPDDMLEEALRRQNKVPLKLVCPWKEGDGSSTEEMAKSVAKDADPQRPLVYHLFGALSGKNGESTAVISEDHYFSHLSFFSTNLEVIPARFPLTDSVLLFVGFHLRDWEFRMLMHCIATLPGIAAQRGMPHVAVQVPLDGDPEERRRAHLMLQQYFSNTPLQLQIYYGTAADFMNELMGRL